MPAINVARTDTFEQQRQKINQIGSAIFNITAGGSDLSTGNLKLGDGTRTEPSLSFINESDLGLYRPTRKTIGIVSEGKKVTEFSNLGTYSFKDMVLQRRTLGSSPTSFTIVNPGSNYDAGTYSDVALIGGTGDLAASTITVTAYDGSINSSGDGYRSGQYIDIGLVGGSGSGAACSFIVRGITGTILNEGSGYVPGTYENVPLTGGSGSGAIANIFVAQPGAGTPGGNITSVTITSDGDNTYNTGEILSVNNSDLGGSGSGFQFEITSENPGKVDQFTFTDKGSNYQTNDVLSFPGSTTGVSTNLRGEVLDLSTTLDSASPIVTLSSTVGIVDGMAIFTAQGDVGQILFGTTVLSVDSSTQITLSQNPSASGAATVSFRSEGNLDQIEVPSLNGIFLGSIVTQTSGTGQLDVDTTVFAIDTFNNVITLSSPPILAGTATLSFAPPFGIPVSNFSYTIGTLGTVESVSITSGGNGYSETDSLTVSSSDLSSPIVYFVKNITVQKLFFPSLIGSAIEIGDTIKKIDGAITTTTLLSSTDILAEENQSYNDVTATTNGDGEGVLFNVFRGLNGVVGGVIVSGGNSGLKYKSGDILTISGNQVGGSSPADDITLEVSSASANIEFTVYGKVLDGSNIDYIITESDQIDLFEDGGIIVVNNNYANTYTISTASPWSFRYLIDLDEGNGFELTPSWDVYVGDTYLFDLTDSSNTSHVFAFSIYRDGIWEPSYIQNVDTTLSISTSSITIADTEGILPGMNVIFVSGSGNLASDTKVLSVPDSTTVILDKAPIQDGDVVLNFRGVTYTDGVSTVDQGLLLKVTENTPNLYYFCDFNNITHVDEGGEDFAEALITVESNNPRTFGSGFNLLVNEVETDDIITLDIESGVATAEEFVGINALLETATISETLNAPSILGNTLTATEINSSSNLGITASNVNVNGDFNIGLNVQIINSSGNITTSGILRTNGNLSVNNILTITDNNIATSAGNNIVLSPPTGNVAKVSATTALTIPAGSSAQRPGSTIVENGSIRFNTDTNQYEGYSATTSSWSSLGGVRDLDGNTYITAEESIGSNDNRLWFYNDNINTVRFTPQYQEFVNVKKIRSVNTSAPASVSWASNTPVTAGQYLKYLNNIYEVVLDGVTGTSGNEPTDTTGNNFTNGTATLRYFTTAVAPLTFEEISELRIAPLGGTSLSINDELRFASNIISTDVNDLLIRPNSGKKVTIDANTSLVLPVGDINERGAPIQGSVRFNTTISQYEGYDGSNWSSLGGVRDVSGDTYIIPELSAGSNENILYFFNNNNNTLRVTENDIQLDTIDTIVSSTSNNLNLNAELITFNNLSASIDTSGSSTFITTTKGNLDLGLSSGLTNDPLLRLSDTGDIYYNLGFGTGVYDGIKVFDSELKELEIADFKILTTKVNLIRNTINSGSATLYDPSLHESAKVQIIAHNTVTGNKEFVEYSVIDNGTDIFFTDFGNVKTGTELISCVFDFNANNNVRVTFTLDNSIVSGNTIEVTVISNIIKR